MSNSSFVGRPRLYEDGALKVAAFRDRQASAGYLRREVLLSPEAAQAVKAIAETQSVSAIDVTSALFEIGLAQYQATYASTATAQGCVRSVSASLSAAAAPAADPVTQFFNRRKDVKNV